MAVFMLDDVAGGDRSRGLSRDVRASTASLIEADAMLLVRGKFEKDEESARLVATELLPIAALQERTTREVAIHLSVPPHGRPTFEALAELLSRHRGDRRVSLELDVHGQRRPAARPRRRRAARPAIGAAGHEVEQLCGADGGVAMMNDRSMRIVIGDRIDLDAICGSGSGPGFRCIQGCPMPDLLEFEEPVGVLLKEIEALSMLPRRPSASGRSRPCGSAPTRSAARSTPT